MSKDHVEISSNHTFLAPAILPRGEFIPQEATFKLITFTIVTRKKLFCIIVNIRKKTRKSDNFGILSRHIVFFTHQEDAPDDAFGW